MESDRSSDPLLGTTIVHRYRIDSLVGRGGMCAVYRAEDLKAKKTVAVKILSAELSANQEMARRFQREATTGKRIAHRNVVAISDSGALDDESLYLVMELVDGRSLATILHEGPIAVPRAIAITRQIVEGLGEAHRLGIAHRDIKPENVLIVGGGKRSSTGEIVKILDFGIASNDRAAMKLTAKGVAFGTPEYISPEMAMGLDVDFRADFYSVGVVLFQMVAGRLPFLDEEAKDLLRAHVDRTPPLLRSVAANSKIPAALEELVAKAMQKLPEKRHPSAEAMIAALDAISAAAARRHSLKMVAAVSLVLLVATGAWLATRGAVAQVNRDSNAGKRPAAKSAPAGQR